MDWIEEIINGAATSGDVERLVGILKSGRDGKLPNYEEIREQINPLKHKIFDKTHRPDRKVKNDDDGGYKTIPVARVALALQKLIVRRAASFVFGTPPRMRCHTHNQSEKRVYNFVKKVLKRNKINSINRKIGKALFSYTEVAECWYVVESKEHTRYGEKVKFKIKSRIFSPAKGDILFPYFDEYGDLAAFSRAFVKTGSDGKKIDFFETYTDSNTYLFVNRGEGWAIEKIEENKIGKIPVIYARQDETEWQDVQHLIENLETVLSNFSDTNAYHSSPKILVKGKLISFAKKGDPASVVNIENDASASYLTWNSAPESVKLEIDTLLRMIYTLSQTPDISFDAIKTLGNGISGEALERLLLDALLKVEDKKEILDEFLDRRANLLVAIVGYYLNLSDIAGQLMIETEIQSFNVSDKTQSISRIKSLTGGKPLVSQQTGIEMVAEIYPSIDAEGEASNLMEEAERDRTHFTHESFIE